MNTPSARLAQITRWLLWASTLLPLALVAVFIVGRWPEYWKWIAAEDTPMTSLEVTVMYTTALVCWGAAATAALRGHTGDVKRWLYLGSGFLWLCLDDRFALHERIRDRILIPHDVRIPFLPVGPGDFILLIYMAIGLASLRWLLPLWQAHRSARRRFIAGVGQILVERDKIIEGLRDLGLGKRRILGAGDRQVGRHLAHLVEGVRADQLTLAIEVRGDDDTVGLLGKVLERATELFLGR